MNVGLMLISCRAVKSTDFDFHYLHSRVLVRREKEPLVYSHFISRALSLARSVHAFDVNLLPFFSSRGSPFCVILLIIIIIVSICKCEFHQVLHTVRSKRIRMWTGSRRCFDCAWNTFGLWFECVVHYIRTIRNVQSFQLVKFVS